MPAARKPLRAPVYAFTVAYGITFASEMRAWVFYYDAWQLFDSRHGPALRCDAVRKDAPAWANYLTGVLAEPLTMHLGSRYLGVSFPWWWSKEEGLPLPPRTVLAVLGRSLRSKEIGWPPDVGGRTAVCSWPRDV